MWNFIFSEKKMGKKDFRMSSAAVVTTIIKVKNSISNVNCLTSNSDEIWSFNFSEKKEKIRMSSAAVD